MIGLNALREVRERIVKLFNAFDIFHKRDAPRLRIEKYEPSKNNSKCYPTKLDFTRPRIAHQTVSKVRIVKKVIK